MTNLDALRRLKRDPAAFSVTRDPSGHTFSPSLKAQQKEIDEKYKEAGALAAKAKAEFEQRYAQGFALREAGDDEAALEQFAAAYILAREINYRAGDKSGELSALFHLGTLRLRMQRFSEAEIALTAAQAIAVALQDKAAEGEKQPPLALLVRAEKLTREIGRGGEPLRMLVLRQLRAQYAKLRNEEGIRACEREIDALHARAQELHEAQKAEQRRRKEQIESLAVDVSAVEVSSAADADPDADEPKAKSGAAAKDEASSERPSPCRQHEQQGVIV